MKNDFTFPPFTSKKGTISSEKCAGILFLLIYTDKSTIIIWRRKCLRNLTPFFHDETLT